MNILDIVEKILEIGYVCDRCLGRQFAQLLHGFTNEERGRILRSTMAMVIDSRGSFGKIDKSNFYNISFHLTKMKEKLKKPRECVICGDIFKKLKKYLKKILKRIERYEFNSFLVGSIIDEKLKSAEENLWERIGINYCEPIKSEINRTIGRELERITGKKANLKNPDIVILVDFVNQDIIVQLNPLFIYGEYQKLVRGIPQTKWPSRKYKESVEEIIGKPILQATRGKDHKFHGLGREDIDARCLGWRPFVIEIIEPKKRSLNFKEIEEKINKSKKVKVRKLRYSSINEVREIKESRANKTYRVRVICKKEITKEDIEKIRTLKGKIVKQRTPSRVLHRRSDKLRKRKLIDIKVRKIGKKELLITLTTEAGFYVKEFVTGDNGRTNPSISSIIGCECEPRDLDVIKIHREF